MSSKILAGSTAIFALLLAAFALSACAGGEGGREEFVLVGEEREIQGTVVDTKLTLCAPTPEKPGTCEGYLLVEGEGGADPVRLEITRDVALKKGEQKVFLPQLQGNVIRATYRAAETGENVATSVVASP
jgi:hypothetical protein